MGSTDLKEPEVSRVIEMAWEDRTPFEAIEALYGLPEKARQRSQNQAPRSAPQRRYPGLLPDPVQALTALSPTGC